jgi:hypothetical protein
MMLVLGTRRVGGSTPCAHRLVLPIVLSLQFALYIRNKEYLDQSFVKDFLSPILDLCRVTEVSDVGKRCVCVAFWSARQE